MLNCRFVQKRIHSYKIIFSLLNRLTSQQWFKIRHNLSERKMTHIGAIRDDLLIISLSSILGRKFSENFISSTLCVMDTKQTPGNKITPTYVYKKSHPTTIQKN